MDRSDTNNKDVMSLGVASALVIGVAIATAVVLLLAMPAKANAAEPGCTGTQILTAL